MKIVYIVALALMAGVPALADEQPSNAAKLESLQGTLVIMMSEDRGVPARIWAKGNNTRTELSDGKQTAVTIQLGDVMYTYVEGSKRTGTKRHMGTGLGSMGFIRQIEEIRAKGKKQIPEEIDGVRYDKYEYDLSGREAMAVVYLSAETSLPHIWLSVIKSGENDASVLKMVYRDMKANVEISDELFKPPADVAFAE